jgi:hypothetical protein
MAFVLFRHNLDDSLAAYVNQAGKGKYRYAPALFVCFICSGSCIVAEQLSVFAGA